MSEILLKTTAILDSFNSRKDKSYTVKFTTQELAPAEVAAISGSLGEFGTLGFVTNEHAAQLEDLEAPELRLEEGQKSPSQRLRNIMFAWWMDKGGKGSFEVFYAGQIETIISQIKTKLPPQWPTLTTRNGYTITREPS